ncbi:proopiomelanocortin b [Trichomycterus rosablanca]|uniref:proopiomelanocortin b n=1 Tax=Trichomycterus rosablanca TaxID=2290929 RepID=UPI002F35F325
MQFVSWLVAVIVLCVCGSAVHGQCQDLSDCTSLSSQEETIDCYWQCRLKQLVTSAGSEQPDKDEDEEDSFSLLLSALVSSRSSSVQGPGVRPQRSEDRPSYSMEHFRWGKPTGRKRRPVKVHASSSPDDEGQEEPNLETPFLPPSRRQLDSGEGHAEEQKKNTKGAERYRMTHFRWSAPPAAKRYGGFMKPWPEESHKSLLTLLRNIIVKDGQ